MNCNLKTIFLCFYKRPGEWHCFGVLSNGFIFGEHLCSTSGWAPNDLYFGRPERQVALNETFGLTVEQVQKQNKIIQVASKADVPIWWAKIGTKEAQSKLSAKYKKFDEIVKREQTKQHGQNI